MKVVVVPHDPTWGAAGAAEAGALRRTLGANATAVHHIGSTAVPGLAAKPIIDILVEVLDLAAVDACSPAMAAVGYEALGEFGIPGRRYFRKDNGAGVRSHQLHAFEAGSAGAVRHLAFREYLRAHPAEARRYGDLKMRLAAAHPDGIDAYMDAKDAFVRALERRALAWHRCLS